MIFPPSFFFKGNQMKVTIIWSSLLQCKNQSHKKGKWQLDSGKRPSHVSARVNFLFILKAYSHVRKWVIYDLKLKCQSLRGQTSFEHKLKHEPVEILGFEKKIQKYLSMHFQFFLHCKRLHFPLKNSYFYVVNI